MSTASLLAYSTPVLDNLFVATFFGVTFTGLKLGDLVLLVAGDFDISARECLLMDPTDIFLPINFEAEDSLSIERVSETLNLAAEGILLRNLFSPAL